MSWQRIKIILFHTWYHMKHSVETWVDVILNPMVQLVVYVYIVVFLSGDAESAKYVLAGAILWNVIWIGQYGITIGALWEIWSRSFSSLFVTPLTLNEFITAQMISSIFKSVFVLGISSLVGYLLYGFSLLSLGWWLVIYFLELLFFSWAVGMFVLGLIFRFGTRIQSFSWLLVFLFQPIGAVFYPLAVLPPFLKTLALFLPITYIFELTRANIALQPLEIEYLFIASLLNCIYLFSSYLFLQYAHYTAKKNGSFVRLEG